MELLQIVRQPHFDRDNERLIIYSCAEWCHKQKDEKLCNAVGLRVVVTFPNNIRTSMLTRIAHNGNMLV